MFSIRKSSTELNDASETRWHFPSALSPEAHAEWGLYKILEYMGLHEILPPGAGENRAKLRKDIEEYHIAYAIDFDDSIIDTFIARRPDCLAMSPNLPVRTSPFGSMHSLVCRCATVLTEEAMTLALAATAASGVDGRLAGACPTASWCW